MQSEHGPRKHPGSNRNRKDNSAGDNQGKEARGEQKQCNPRALIETTLLNCRKLTSLTARIRERRLKEEDAGWNVYGRKEQREQLDPEGTPDTYRTRVL